MLYTYVYLYIFTSHCYHEFQTFLYDSTETSRCRVPGVQSQVRDVGTSHTSIVMTHDILLVCLCVYNSALRSQYPAPIFAPDFTLHTYMYYGSKLH
jgi:hypothetical protein